MTWFWIVPLGPPSQEEASIAPESNLSIYIAPKQILPGRKTGLAFCTFSYTTQLQITNL